MVSTIQNKTADVGCVPIDTHEIKRLRESLGLTMDQAAKRAKFSHRQTWWQIENGKRNVSLAMLENVAAALGVKAKDLLK